ncbi:MAG: Uridine kinase [Bogoriella megaspora]|nr:MAG: Uridine kinase [Bogoriella megaspora]
MYSLVAETSMGFNRTTLRKTNTIFHLYLIFENLIPPLSIQFYQPIILKTPDIIVPRGIENKVAISMVSDRVRKTLDHKSKLHQLELKRLGAASEDDPLSTKITTLPPSPQATGINTILLTPSTDREDFIFYFDRLATLLIETASSSVSFSPSRITTPQRTAYSGLQPSGEVSAVVILRGGSALETGLKRVIPDCLTGRILIQTSYRTGEPELHFRKLPTSLPQHELVLLLDAQMSSGGAALMAVRVLVDHGVEEGRIVYVCWMAGRQGLKRLCSVFPDLRVVVGRVVEDLEVRWVERKYLGC